MVTVTGWGVDLNYTHVYVVYEQDAGAAAADVDDHVAAAAAVYNDDEE